MNDELKQGDEDGAAAAVAAARKTLNPPPSDKHGVEGAVAGAMTRHPAADMPAAITVADVAYLWLPEAAAYVDEEGGELDLSTPPARKALFAWRKQRLEAESLRAEAEARAEVEPEELHAFHVKPDTMRAYEGGRRWLMLDELRPGNAGNRGVQVGHGVVLTCTINGQRHQLQYRITDVHEDVVSVEPGHAIAAAEVAFRPKAHVRAWLEAVAADEGMTVDRWLRRTVHNLYAIDPRRAGVVTGGAAGRADPDSEVMRDLAAARAAKG